MKSTISELVIAIGLGLVVLIGMNMISHAPAEKVTDPRWISAGAEVVQMVFVMYLMWWAWRANYALNRFLAVLTGDMDGVNPNLVGVISMLVKKFNEEAMRMSDECNE